MNLDGHPLKEQGTCALIRGAVATPRGALVAGCSPFASFLSYGGQALRHIALRPRCLDLRCEWGRSRRSLPPRPRDRPLLSPSLQRGWAVRRRVSAYGVLFCKDRPPTPSPGECYLESYPGEPIKMTQHGEKFLNRYLCEESMWEKWDVDVGSSEDALMRLAIRLADFSSNRAFS